MGSNQIIIAGNSVGGFLTTQIINSINIESINFMLPPAFKERAMADIIASRCGNGDRQQSTYVYFFNCDLSTYGF